MIFLCRNRLIASALLLALFSACDQSDPVEEVRQASLLMGDSGKMIMVNHDSLRVWATPYLYEEMIESIDLDGDGMEDLDLGALSWASSGGSGASRIWINCVDTSLWVSFHTTRDTTWAYTSIYSGIYEDVPFITYSTKYSCYQETPQFQVHSIDDNKKIHKQPEGDSLLAEGEWDQGDIDLWESHYDQMAREDNSGDTLLRYITSSYDGCDMIVDQPFYLGFRMGASEDLHLGWIKLVIHNSSSFTLLETAIQE